MPENGNPKSTSLPGIKAVPYFPAEDDHRWYRHDWKKRGEEIIEGQLRGAEEGQLRGSEKDGGVEVVEPRRGGLG